MRQFKIIVEKHPDGYVSYPLGLKGVVVGQGDTYEEALSDVKSAIRFHIETFGEEVLEVDPPSLRHLWLKQGSRWINPKGNQAITGLGFALKLEFREMSF